MNRLEELIGKTIGRYRIKRCLGVGGMGAVYLGEHLEIQSKVAIKVLLPRHVSDPEIVRRFMDEARAANRIGHPGIVRVHDFDSQEDVGVFLIMEYLEGETLLKRHQTGGNLAVADVARFIKQAASALQACHEAGIIHRDMKPSNLFLTRDPEMPGGERIKILDFGIAKLIEIGNQRISSTRTGVVLGSPHYMSPEQCLDTKGVDRRADIYSLGAIAFFLTSGRHPFEAETLGKLILKQRSERPVPLSALDPRVPQSFSGIIDRALETELDRRFQTMNELVGALREVEADLAQGGEGQAAAGERWPAAGPKIHDQPTILKAHAPRPGESTAQLRPASRAAAEVDLGAETLIVDRDAAAEGVLAGSQAAVSPGQALEAIQTVLEENLVGQALQRSPEAEKLSPAEPVAGSPAAPGVKVPEGSGQAMASIPSVKTKILEKDREEEAAGEGQSMLARQTEITPDDGIYDLPAGGLIPVASAPGQKIAAAPAAARPRRQGQTRRVLVVLGCVVVLAEVGAILYMSQQGGRVPPSTGSPVEEPGGSAPAPAETGAGAVQVNVLPPVWESAGRDAACDARPDAPLRDASTSPDAVARDADRPPPGRGKVQHPARKRAGERARRSGRPARAGRKKKPKRAATGTGKPGTR